MITIYHNTRCSKSRCALEILGKKKEQIKIIEYLKTPPSEKELKSILKKLGMKAEEIIRRKEPLFRKFQNKNFSEEQWLKILAANPVLIERPIVVKGNHAIIARPPEKVKKFL
ncbi:MAG: arsenate reductase (glutaredoxin) [Bacteroidetes bacterium]|nr:arsenate reductase (glutaredoxin) [Bacteroidota bacterium]